jgi:RHS repeat-associated protein
MISYPLSFVAARLRAMLVVLLLSGAAGAALACPDDGGPTCGGADAPASQPATAGVNVGAGNPINVMTGNKYQREDDLPALPGVLGLEIVRHYNSRFSGPAAVPGVVGRGWKLSYETELAVDGDMLRVWQADGSSFMFRRDLVNQARANGADPASGSIAIRRNRAGRDEYLWRWADGRELSFDQRGKLVQIKAATGEILSLLYDARGLLVKVTDPQGRSLHLAYLDRQQAASADRFRGVQSIDSPVGKFSYEYGSPMPQGAALDRRQLLANLVRVRYPLAGTGRQYHYEDAVHASFLTGITIEGQGAGGKPSAQRYASFGYQADGRAVLSTHANNVDKVTLSYERPGLTVITNSVGQQTIYRYATVADDYRLLEVRGAGCALCGPPNQRYRYDQRGRLVETSQLDAQGQALQTQKTDLDQHGRPVLVSRIDYVKGKAQAAQWQTRYEYAAGSAAGPTLIARPSVVPGREAVTRIAYNDRAQPTSVSAGGWSPQPEGMGEPVAILRTTRYDYRVVNGVSVLARADGPLANGKTNSPADSDITQFDYDADGRHVVRTIAPGGIVTTVRERDAALRPVAVSRSDGEVEQTAYNRVNWLGQTEVSSVEALRPNDGGKQTRTLRYAYDAMGHLSGVTQPGNLTTSYVYNDAGRPVQRVLPDGSRIAMQQDTEGRKPGAASPAGIEHDPWGRPVVWRDVDGAQLLQAAWGAIGTAAQGAVLTLNTGNAQAQRLLDDDGRVVAIRNPGQGWQTARYDAAGRIEETTDPRGARQHASWDAAGRLLRIERFAPGGRAAEQVLSYRYAGAWVSEESIADADGTRTTLTERDAQGRVLRETLRIAAAGPLAATLAQPVQLSQAYRYDAQGRVLARTLTDNTGRALELATTLDEQGLPSRIAAMGALPGWLGGQRTVIDRIQWQRLASAPYATEIAHGDGSVDRYARIDGAAAAAAADSAAQAAAVAVPEGDAVAQAGAGPDAGPERAPLTGPGRAPDRAGLPSVVLTPQGEQRLQWNAAGQLSETRRAQGGSRYVYDARGRRVVKLVTDAQGARAALSVYEGSSLVAEADAQGRASFAYVHIGWRPVAQIDLRAGHWWQALQARLFGVAAHHLHTSRAGKVLSMTEGGKVVWQERTAHGADGAHQPLRYVGQYHDDDSGLDYHGARYFDAGSGRFISPDPRGVADAVNELAGGLLLDLYAYAGGQPDDYFDPDGAARIRYFAITTNASGQALGTNQGFTKARWAFIVDNLQGGGDSSALGQKRNEYAANGTGLLVDANGNFLSAGQTATTWTGGAGGVPDLFTEHYGTNLISIPAFTINDMSDNDATALIASYIAADRKALFPNACPARGLLLPSIKFAPEEVPINITTAAYKNPNNSSQTWASSQRIVACGDNATGDAIERRIQKYNYAAMLLESSPSQIYKNCASDGCPGHSLDSTVLAGYVASYGQTQFIGSTMVETLRKLRSGTMAEQDANVRRALQLDDAALWTSVNAAYNHANYVTTVFNSHTATTPAWASLSQAARTAFMNGSGLDANAAATIWNDMNRWKQNPSANLNGEARAAFATQVLMTDPVVRTYLMGIFKDSAPGGRFSMVSLALMRSSYRDIVDQVDQTNSFAQSLPNGSVNPQWQARQRQIEIELGLRTARMHNGDYDRSAQGGTLAQVLAEDSNVRGRQYAHRFLNVQEYPVQQPTDPRRQQPTADYFSLRCTSQLPPAAVPRGGLEMKPLQLN